MSESSPPVSSFPLTKFLHPDDYQELAPELAVVDAVPLGGQHPHRRWEYAMALRALAAWAEASLPLRNESGVEVAMSASGLLTMCRALDVGGAGSPLAQILVKAGLGGVRVIDPSLADGPQTLESYLAGGGGAEGVVTCVSVLEHVPKASYVQFVSSLALAVRRGGLLFLTSDAREDDPDEPRPIHLTDDRHFNWMRERIYNPRTWRQLVANFHCMGFRSLGAVDYTWRGPQVYDYSFSCAALVKEGL